MLRDHAIYLETMHPDLATQIRAGLVLATLGRVIPQGDYSETLTNTWQVLGETYEVNGEGKPVCKTYTVRDLQTTPRRWSCSCEQGQSYGPLTGEFLNRPGRVCKHITAVAIHWLHGKEIARPTTIYEMVARLVEGQAIYLLAGESLELPTSHKIKLEYYDKNGKSGLCLKTGRARSEILARWLPVENQPSGGEWRLVSEAQGLYTEFVGKINGGAK